MKWFKFVNKITNGIAAAELYISGYIDDVNWTGTDVTPFDFKAELDALNGIDVDLYINSGGGNVFAGNQIGHFINRYPGKVTGHVDGIAASIASGIYAACDVRKIYKNSMIMIHKPSGIAIGTADDMIKTAEVLDGIQNALATTYAEVSKKSIKEINKMMNDETWFTGEEAISAGFADELEAKKSFSSSVQNRTAIINGQSFDMDKYKAFPVEKLVVQTENNATAPAPVDCSIPKHDYSIFENQLTINDTLIKEIVV
jgi:ATP-dependent Clp protease protease subunit